MFLVKVSVPVISLLWQVVLWWKIIKSNVFTTISQKKVIYVSITLYFLLDK